MTLVDGALSGTHVYTPESLDLKLKLYNEEISGPQMTVIMIMYVPGGHDEQLGRGDLALVNDDGDPGSGSSE